MVSLHPETGGIAAMMGVKDRVFDPLPRDFSLEDLVPRDNFYRRLEERLDLSFVRELVAPLYARGGRPSVDPVVFFKLQLVMLFESIRSERELMRVAADRLSVRWYLGYDLGEPLPDHSNLTRTRERFGLAVFRRFFEEVVELCAEAGLVRGDELFFDSTKVEADADIDSLSSRYLVENHLDGLFEEEPANTGTSRAGTAPTTVMLPTAEDRELLEGNVGRSDWVSRAGRQDRAFVSGTRKRTADLRVSRTDPDATPMRVGAGETKLGYQAHYVVDGAGTPYDRLVELGGQVLVLGAPLETMTLVHHAEAIAEVPGKRRVSYGMPVMVGGERFWRTFSDIDTSEGALPYERVLGEEEDYIEHIARSALAAGAGRSEPVGEATAYLFDARALVEHAVGWIERNFASEDLDGP